uniref:Rho GTPase-activating protein 39 n=1 Tax=Hirondellea gigas TaxID=1518452 RepID=A0A6A7G4P9_9CRUS
MSSSSRQYEWVEIIEPTSRKMMYISLVTGECAWEPPAAVPYKKFDCNQWWELFDSKSMRFYYYNAANQKTEWHHPPDCDILPLAKLQNLKQNTEVGGAGLEMKGIFLNNPPSQAMAAARAPVQHHQPGNNSRRYRHHHHHHDPSSPHHPPQPSPSPSPRPSRRHYHNQLHESAGVVAGQPRRRRASQSSQAPSRSLKDGFDSNQFLVKQQSLDGVSIESRSSPISAAGVLRGSPAEGNLERPRQLGLSRSHSFMSGPLGGSTSGRGLAELGGDRGPASRHAHLHSSHHHQQSSPADSLEGLATPMMHRRHRNEKLDRRQESDRPLRASASAHCALNHQQQQANAHYQYSNSDDSSPSPSPPTQRHKFSPINSPSSSINRNKSNFSPLGSPLRQPDSGTSTLTTDHTCCSPHASQHSLFDSGHMSMGTTGSRGSDNRNYHRKSSGGGGADSVSRKSDKSDTTTSPTASISNTANSAAGGGRSRQCSHHRGSGSRSSNSASNSHHHQHRHRCAKHKTDRIAPPIPSSLAQQPSSNPYHLMVNNSSSHTNTNSSGKNTTTTTDSDTLHTSSSHHTNNSNNPSQKTSPNNTSVSSTPSTREQQQTVQSKQQQQQQHHDLTHLYSNLEYVYDQPVYKYILEQAQLSGYRLGDRIVGGEGDSLHSDSDNEARNDDSDHFADDEAVSNADSSSQENLDEINYLADDETYTQFFSPPAPVPKTAPVPAPQLPSHFPPASSIAYASSAVVTSTTAVATPPSSLITAPVVAAAGIGAQIVPIALTNASVISNNSVSISKIAAVTVNSSISNSICSTSNSAAISSIVGGAASGVNVSNSSGISGVISIVSGGGGVMGVGASSSSIAESLSRLAVSNTAPSNTQPSSLTALAQKQDCVGGSAEEGGEGSSIMEKYAKENLNIHTRGLLRKKVPVITMISWTKDCIRKPLLSTVDKNLAGTACDMFRLVQVYMSDRKPKPGMTLNSVALDIVLVAYYEISLRDELFVQLCKQTTDNHKKESLRRGWELMAIALQFFSPGERLSPHLACYFNRHTDPAYTTMFPDVNKWPIHIQVAHYAGVCQKRLSRLSSRTVVRKPCAIEVDLAKLHIFRVSMFGSTLTEVMQLQRDRYPHRRLPWVQTALSEEVLRLQGTNTEGIFRVPADSDEVQQVKRQVDKWEVGECGDAHIAAAVLKSWYRELHEPLIPHQLYEAAIEAHDSPREALDLLHHLPQTNRLVLAYLIRFLQYFAQTDIVAATKMDGSNLAMVMAPNCLRCTHDDPRILYTNSRKEMQFIKLLILHLDTTFMEGVV